MNGTVMPSKYASKSSQDLGHAEFANGLPRPLPATTEGTGGPPFHDIFVWLSQHLALLLLSFLLGTMPSCSAQRVTAANRIVVNPGQGYQVIEGFGLNFTGPYFREDQKAMFDMFIHDLGATLFRVVPYLVYSNWEETNDNDDPNVMNWEYYNDRYSTAIFEATWSGLRYLNSQGIHPVIALMGPVPGWMTDSTAAAPEHSVCSKDTPSSQQGHLNPDMYDEFAEEVVSMAVYARTRAHISFEYFSPFNETDCYPPEGPRIDPAEAPRVLRAVARRLRKEGLGDVKLTVADQAIMTNDYIGPILQDAELMRQVGAFTFHTYGENSVGPQVARVHASPYTDLPVWLTEYGDLNDRDRSLENEWKHYSLAAGRRALLALNQGASALFYFDAFDDYEECAKRLCYYGLFQSANHVYAPKKRYYATRQLYHFVRPGWQRIGATTQGKGLTVAAFRNPSGRSLAVVGVKQGGPNVLQLSLQEDRPAPRTWELYETTRELDCQRVETVSPRNETVEIQLPDEVVFTLLSSTQ